MGLNGREITILENGQDVLADFRDFVKLEIEDNIALNISSDFTKQLMEGSSLAGSASTLASVVGVLTKSPDLARTTLQSSMMSARIWGGSNPISINLSLTFHVGVKNKYDPKNQVYEPIRRLSRLPLPWLDGMKNLVAPGTVAGDVLITAAEDFLHGVFKYEGDVPLQSTVYSISIGDILYLPWVVVERAEPTFSKQMAKASDGKFYPIHGRIDMTISTIRAGTREMLAQPAGENYEAILARRKAAAGVEDATGGS